MVYWVDIFEGQDQCVNYELSFFSGFKEVFCCVFEYIFCVEGNFVCVVIECFNFFGQVGMQYCNFVDWECDELVSNFFGVLVGVDKCIQDKMFEYFIVVDVDYGQCVCEGIQVKEVEMKGQKQEVFVYGIEVSSLY